MRKLLLGFYYLVFLILPVACTYDQLAVVEACDNNLVLTIAEQTSSACGLTSGAVTAAITGEAAGAPVTFSLNGIDFQESPTFTDLAAGSYTLTAQQGACTVMIDVTLENAEGLNATAAAMPSDCGATNGSITVSTADAGGEVTFSITGGTSQADPTFTGLAPGMYEITAQDEIGCQVILEATVTSTVAFAEVEAIVTSSCAISGCHAGNVSPDFRVRGNILSRAGRIGSRTGNASMPPPSSGNSLSEQQVNAISCWVADGAPE
ncbi:hypothetical protein [Neolewinella persica]|uniref:hypothetical protein n=1 Tax=Neolewinella persica TaxID=70998 RepID=UPI00036F9955|nr:hypothetical protein [Neolewinella persica]